MAMPYQPRQRSKASQMWLPGHRLAGAEMAASAKRRSAMWLPPEPEEPERGPAQRPIEELAGFHFTGDMVREMAPDPFKRPKFSNEACYRAWCELEEEHFAHRDAPLPIEDQWFDPGFLALLGIMGAGKTAIAAVWARRFYRRGWTVQSTAGLLFGQRWGPEELYNFAANIEPGSFTFQDEIHTGFHAGSAHALREESWSDGTTGMRKDRHVFMGATAFKRLPSTFRNVVDWAGWPRRAYFPELKAFPPACLNVFWLGPKPYDGMDLMEEMGFASHDETRLSREQYDPFEVEECFKLFDSFERVKTLFGDHLNADRFREVRSNGKPAPLTDQEIATDILNWYADGHFQSQEAAYWAFMDQEVDLERHTRARSQCMVRFEEIAALFVSAEKPKVGAKVLRRVLAGVGVGSGNAGVLISGLADAYERLAKGPFG